MLRKPRRDPAEERGEAGSDMLNAKWIHTSILGGRGREKKEFERIPYACSALAVPVDGRRSPQEMRLEVR